jgi:segregation and condensation protein A
LPTNPQTEASQNGYTVTTPTFEGPLDLLLQLVEKRQLDITTVSLALVTDQYVEHLRAGVGIDSEQLSEFIAVAAKLLHIKSVALLPRPMATLAVSAVEDPTDLTERLREYEAIKRGALTLREREDSDQRSYPHAAPGDLRDWLARIREESSRQLDLFGGTREVQPAAGLTAALRRVTARRKPEPMGMAREKWTVAEAVRWLAGRLRVGIALRFGSVTAGFDRHRSVGAFLAILELHRQERLIVRQDTAFGDIEIEAISGESELTIDEVTSETIPSEPSSAFVTAAVP